MKKDEIRFNKWWDVNGKTTFMDSQDHFMLAIKKVAKKAWDAKKCNSEIKRMFEDDNS